MTLVPGRECGTCTVCCKVLPIRSPELNKTSHVLCEHCDAGQGCRIYQTRPLLCRNYHCGWRMWETLPDDWRPDQSGVFVDRVKFLSGAEGEIPAQYDKRFMVQLLLLRAALRIDQISASPLRGWRRRTAAELPCSRKPEFRFRKFVGGGQSRYSLLL